MTSPADPSTKLGRVKLMLSRSFNASDATISAMNEQPELKAILDAEPAFVDEIRGQFLDMMAPFFEPMSDPTIDALMRFYETSEAAEFRRLQEQAASKIGMAMQKWVAQVQVRLVELIGKAKRE